MKKYLKKPLPTFLVFLFVCTPTVAEAAISFVSSTCENSRDGNGDMTLTLPTVLENDLVIIAFAIGDNDGLNFDMDASGALSGAGYTEVTDAFADDTSDISLGVYWKIMGVTPDTSVTIDGQGGNDASTVAVCIAFRGVDTTNPMDVTPVGGATLNTMDPNPGPIDHNNPSGVWTVAVGASGYSGGAGVSTYTFPTGYTTNAIDRDHDDTTDATVGIGYRSTGVSDPEDPGILLHSIVDNIAFSAATTTIALRPQTVVAPTVQTNAETNQTPTSVTLNGNITNTGGATVTVRGFEWGDDDWVSSEGIPDYTTTESGSFGTGTFGHDIRGLIAGKTYYYRAYATNSAGTGNGTLEQFVAGTDTSLVRTTLLFEGYTMKIYDGKVIFHQRN